MGVCISNCSKHLLALLLASTIALNASAAQPDEQGSIRKHLEAVRSESPPYIDGLLDDGAWQKAAVVDDLHMIKPNEYASPSELARIHVIYHDLAIYIAAREAYESAQVREAMIEPAAAAAPVSASSAGPIVVPLTEHTTGPEPLLKTGS